MAYATLQDLIDRYGERTVITSSDRDGNGQADADAVAHALDEVSSEIDTYLAARYALPLPEVPSILVRLACDMALHQVSFEAGAATDEKKARYDSAVDLLKLIAKGTVQLPLPPAAAVTTTTAPRTSSPAREFTRNTLKGVL